MTLFRNPCASGCFIFHFAIFTKLDYVVHNKYFTCTFFSINFNFNKSFYYTHPTHSLSHTLPNKHRKTFSFLRYDGKNNKKNFHFPFSSFRSFWCWLLVNMYFSIAWFLCYMYIHANNIFYIYRANKCS